MGRHRQGRAFLRLGRQPILLAGLLAAALVGSVTAVRLAGSPPSRVGPACTGDRRTLSVGADTSVRPWLAELARRYTAAHRRVGGRCVEVSVREMTVTEAQQALQPVPFPGGGPPPDVWVPESSTALDLVRSRPDNAKVLPSAAPAVATSPIVVGAPPDAAHALSQRRLPAGQLPQLGDFLLLSRDPAGWGQQHMGHDEWGRVVFSTSDPDRSTLGASLLVAAAGAVTGTSAHEVTAKTFTTSAAKQGLLLFTRSLIKVTGSSQELLDEAGRVRAVPDLLAAFGLVVTYEQDLWRYNSAAPPVLLQATYPLGGAMAADYPFVVPNASWVDGADRRAAADFRAWLTSSAVQSRLGAFGLRRANGTAPDSMRAVDHAIDPAPQRAQPVRAADAPAAARAAWRLLTQRVSILALIDVSGSMVEKVPNTNQTKLGLAVAAGKASLQYFDDSDRIGLWEFSSTLSGKKDYRELVPLGNAGDRVGRKTRRQASLDAYAAMRPASGTALYDSTLAAYAAAQAHYRPGYVNTVVLLSDGKNEDDASISLADLLRQLKKRYSLARPVHIVTIGYGRDADPAVLGQIARATDGVSFVSPDPRNIGEVFLTAVSALSS